MFWGLIMEPNKRYTQTVEKPFHISQAAMDTSTGDNEICQVMVVVDGKNFLVCTLQKNKTIQVPLDLYFKTGNVISFLTNGKCNVHLTGYLDPEFDEEEESDGDEEEEEEEEEEAAPELVPAKNKNKRKLDSSIESSTKKLKQDTKKVLKQQVDTSQDSDSDDVEGEEEEDDDDDAEEDSSEEDSAGDLQKLLDGDVDSDENDESFKPNSTGGASEEEDSGEDSDELHKSEADTSVGSQSAESPAKLSRSQKRRLKKLQTKKQQEQPQTNGVAEKKKAKKEQPEQKQKPGKQESKTTPEIKPATPEKRESKKLASGVQIDDLKVGSGPAAKPGKVVQVYYEGRLKQNNKMFDSCLKGPGFKFRLGSKEVISGWDVGVSGMKVGGKRKIVCPPSMAYGAKGSPPVIPPNSTLVFEVELKNVK